MNHVHGPIVHRTGNRKILKAVYLIALAFTCSQHLSCSKKNIPFEPTDALGIANKWVYDSLKLYYYWADQMGKPDYSLPTPEFFKSLLSPADRFSAITNERDVEVQRSVYEHYGFYYSLISHPLQAQQWVGVVTMVLPNSIAAQSLQRGDFFTKVNDIPVSKENVDVILQQFAAGKPVRLVLASFNDDGTQLTDQGEVSVMGGGVPFRSVNTASIFELNGIKTAYLSYLQCIESQDNKVLDVLLRFRQAGVSELILDLRFNPGGSVASSAKLAAMLVPAFNPDDIYVTFQGNRAGGTVRQSFQKTISFSASSPGKSMQELQFRNLHLSRLFILTSGATISAAEILCHNLKPYMPVVRIGGRTYGKDEASFRIEDRRSPKQVPWILYPIVYKIADANGRGGYSSGLAPDHEVNEFGRLPLTPAGMPGDPSLDKALQLIYGTTAVGATPVRRKTFTFGGVKEVYQSATNAPGVEFRY